MRQHIVDRARAKLQSNEPLIVVGDYNAHVGNDHENWPGVIGRHGDEHLNENGKLLLDFCVGNSLTVMNTFFEHRDVHKYTWFRGTQRSLIDFVMVSPDLRKRVMDVRVKRGAELSTDHHLVVATFRCCGSVPVRKQRKRTKRIKWEALEEAAVRENLAKELSAKYQAIPTMVADVETEWALFKGALLEVSEKCCGTKWVGPTPGGSKRTAWWTEEVKEAVKRKKTLFKQWLGNKTLEARDNYQVARREAAIIVKEAKAKTERDFCKKLEKDRRNAPKLYWQAMKRMRNPEESQSQTVRSKLGTLLSEDQAVVSRWQEYFDELLNPTTASPPVAKMQIKTETVLTTEEVTRAITRLKTGKSAGADEIRPEMLKATGEDGIAWIQRLFQVAWDTGETPQEWQIGVVAPIFKKGDKAECSNYRGISLLSLPAKLYAKILEVKVRAIVEDKISETQGGFRPGRSTTDQLFTLRQLCEKVWEYNLPAFLTFVDLKRLTTWFHATNCGTASESTIWTKN